MDEAMKTSIIVPTYCRPAQLRRTVERLLYTVSDLDTEVIVSAEVDENSLPAVADLPVKAIFHPDWRGSVANWTLGAAEATGDLLVTGADDLWWGDGWLHETLRPNWQPLGWRRMRSARREAAKSTRWRCWTTAKQSGSGAAETA